jgi:glycosyltransferase involved in cell wall biosynthesis
MKNILLIKILSIDDSINSGDFRTWHLLDKGNANVFYFKSKQTNINGKQIKERLSWNTHTQLLTDKFPSQIKRQDFLPYTFFKRNQEQAIILKNFIEQYLKINPNALIYAYGHDIGILLAEYFADKLIFESCDSASLYYYRRFQYLKNNQIMKKLNSYIWSLVYQKIEQYLSQRAKLYLVPSQADKDWILKLNPQANVTAIGNGTPWVDQPILNRFNHSHKSPIIAFHGGMTWDPNRVTAIYLIEKILPLIKIQSPSVLLRIAGTPIFAELKKLDNQPNVEICGFVEDIRDWLAECDVYVMPMLQGSGVKNKLIEAMAAGLTVVTNSLGAEALPEEARQGVIIADGEENIANAVIYLLNNPEESLELAKKARVMAEKYFRWEALSQQLMTKLEEISQQINNV